MNPNKGCNHYNHVLEWEITHKMESISPTDNLKPTPRIFLFYFAVLVQLFASAISGSGFLLNSPILYVVGFAAWVLWFVMIFSVVLPGADTILNRHLNGLKMGATIIFITLSILGLAEAIAVVAVFPRVINDQNIPSDFRQVLSGLKDVYQYNDGTALTDQAVDNLLAGKNPYTNANIVRALLEHNGACTRVTPLRVGAFSDVFPYPQDTQLEQLWSQAIQTPNSPPPELESRVCYPAVSFLLPAPFILAGINDIRIVYAIFVMAGLICAAWLIPKQKRLLFIGASIISLELWNSIAGGETGSLCFPLLLVSWLTLNRNMWVSVVFLGLAVSDKQTAWFFIPFYFILLLRTQGVKKLAASLAMIAGIFAVTNLPFVISNPSLWLTSITSPMTDPMFPIGGGLTILVTGGILPVQSSRPFTILEVIAFVIAIAWYWRFCVRYPQTGPLLAIVPLFFAWRSLWSYFFYAAIIALAYIMVNENEKLPSPAVNTQAARPV